MYRKVYLDFQDGSGFRDVSSYVKYDTLQVTPRAFSDNWHFAQNTASFSLIYDPVIYPLLRYNEKEIIVRIVDVYDESLLITENNYFLLTENGFYLARETGGFEPSFYGRIPPTKSRTYNGLLDNTFFDVEAVDELSLLDKAAGDICYRDYFIMNPSDTAHSIVHQLAYLCGMTDSQIDSSVYITDVIEAFTPPDPNDICRDLLDTLLFEYGWVLNMSLGGQISPLRWIQNADTTFEFNETNIIQQIEISDTLKTYDGAEVIYYELGEAVTVEGNNEMLLYRDGNLPYDSDGSFAGYPIPNGFSYPPETNVTDETTGLDQIVYQEYDDNAVKYWTNKAIVERLDYNYKAFSSDFSAIVATSDHRVDWLGDAGLTLIKSVFENRRAELVIDNPTAEYLNLYYLNVYGKVLYKTAERKAIVKNVTTAENLDKYVSTFIFSKAVADTLAIRLAKQHLINSTQYAFISEVNRPVGEFVRVLLGDGTDQNSVIVEKSWNEATEQFKYRVRAYNSEEGTLTTQTYSTNPIAPVPENINLTTEQGDLVISSNLNGSSPILTNAFFVLRVYRDGKDDTSGWGFSATPTGITGSFGAGADTNKWTVTGFDTDATMLGSVIFTATRTGFTNRTLTRKIEKIVPSDAITGTDVVSYAPKYLGRYDHAHPATTNVGDWWTVYHTDNTAPQRGVWWNNNNVYERITISSSVTVQAKFVEALTDVAWAEAQTTYGVASDYGIATLFQTLGVVTAFINELFAQNITVTPTGTIKSDNYVANTSGFKLTGATGLVESVSGKFKNCEITGQLATGGSITGPKTSLDENSITLRSRSRYDSAQIGDLNTTLYGWGLSQIYMASPTVGVERTTAQLNFNTTDGSSIYFGLFDSALNSGYIKFWADGVVTYNLGGVIRRGLSITTGSSFVVGAIAYSSASTPLPAGGSWFVMEMAPPYAMNIFAGSTIPYVAYQAIRIL